MKIQDRVKDIEDLGNPAKQCWYLKNTMASTPGAKSCLNEGPILHHSTIVFPMPVHGTPRELFKVLLDAFKVGLIKAFKVILKAFFKIISKVEGSVNLCGFETWCRRLRQAYEQTERSVYSFVEYI